MTIACLMKCLHDFFPHQIKNPVGIQTKIRLHNLIQKTYPKNTHECTGYTVTGTITCSNTHLLFCKKGIVEISAYYVAGKEKYEKVINLSFQHFRIRH